MPRKRQLIDKQAKKRIDGQCVFCEESDYEVLDVHRIIPGEEGGRYTEINTVTTCCACHRRIHAGQIKIDRKYPSTSGRYVVHYWDEDGEEKWK